MCWPNTVGHGACSGVWLIHPVISIGELCLLHPLSVLGFLFGLNLCRSCMCYQSLSSYVHYPVMSERHLFPWVIYYLLLLKSFSLHLSSLSLKVRVLMKISDLGCSFRQLILSAPESLSAHYPVVSFC